MSWVSERNLVSALSNAGAFGVLACGSMPPALLAEEIEATAALTDRPFGVNLITLHPELDALIDVCIEHQGWPRGPGRRAAARQPRSGGSRMPGSSSSVSLLHLALAKRLIRNGVDALVIEGSEAGGHIGPVVTSVLAQEILPNVKEVPVFVAGGIGRGEAVRLLSRDGSGRLPVGDTFRLRDANPSPIRNFKTGVSFAHRRAMPCRPYSWIPVSRSFRSGPWSTRGPRNSWKPSATLSIGSIAVS